MNKESSTNFPATAESQQTNQEIFTEAEAAQLLKVSRITLQRARLRGEIAFCRIGGCRVIYTRKHLEDYLAQQERVAYKPRRGRKSAAETTEAKNNKA